jgi:NAD(P)-dependent dehydrogenase (short-subunit alcohol dehydrogenase family)
MSRTWKLSGGPSTDHSPISVAWRWWSVTPATVCSAPQRRLPTIKFDRQINTNLIGSIALIRACLPHLRRQGGGHILQVSSEGGQMTYPGFSLYHATKWGIEGFVEAVAKEVEPFGIRFTLVEPGPTGTNFGAGLVKADPLPAYDETPVGELRRAWAAGSFRVTGDASKVVDAMIAVADDPLPPIRLTLGSMAYESIRSALGERVGMLEAGKEVTLSVDRT